MNGRDINGMKKTPSLEHRHFCFIAAVMAESKPAAHWDANKHAQWQSIVNAFTAACKRSNSKFSADRFIDACNHDK